MERKIRKLIHKVKDRHEDSRSNQTRDARHASQDSEDTQVTEPDRSTQSNSDDSRPPTSNDQQGIKPANTDEVHDAIVKDYQAYLPALSPNLPEQLAGDLQHVSLDDEPPATAQVTSGKEWKDIGDPNHAEWVSGAVKKPANGRSSESHTDRPEENDAGKVDRGARTPPKSTPREISDVEQRHDQDVDREVAYIQESSDKEQKGNNGQARTTEARPDSGFGVNLDGVVDLNDSVDVDKRTRVAPAVVHETVKPHIHEIREEKIYREIHNHDYFHYTQPVYQTVVLPARHFVPNPNGEGVIEVSESQLPGCTGKNQRWSISTKDDRVSQPIKPAVRRLEPIILKDITYMTSEGFERRETTILHPPELADMSQYKGPVLEVHFDESGVGKEMSGMDQHSQYFSEPAIPQSGTFVSH